MQTRLAHIMATKALFAYDSEHALDLPLPPGQATARIGRKLVLILGLLGEVMAAYWIVMVYYFHNVFLYVHSH
ncbi:hypothetical protein B0T14DRAFT_124967 [Immersiella caudata]|uniref:Uncharacterized protein n=1 Tax=Immersiella caudata TaxID=314043 RepID=A0AA39X4F2_9PEZI|nr:hypothetical protein B0T14DRAFT_124967 [Immersiella caudata]